MAKRYIDKSIDEQQAERAAGFSKRMQNLTEAGSGMVDRLSQMATGLVKEEVFGIPGLLGDLAVPASVISSPVLYATNPKVRENVSQFAKDFGASGLAAKAGVELSDEFFDEQGELRPEMAGRFLAPGALYAKVATLAPKVGRGLQDLVSGLRDNDFFPPNGPQLNPVTVAPDPRTTFPMDKAPVPETSVMLNEARGTGSTDARLVDLISKGDINTPEDIKSFFPDFRILNPEDFPSQDKFEYAEKSAQYKLINQYRASPKEKKIKKTLAPNPETYMISEEGASMIGDAHSPLLDVLKKMDIPPGGIAGSSVIEQVGKQLSNRRNIELDQYGLVDYFSKNADKKFSREELIETFDTVAPSIDVKTVMETDLQTAGVPSLAYQTPDGVTDAAALDGHGVIVFGNRKGAQVGGVKLKGVPGHDYFKDDISGFFGQVRFSIVPDPYNPDSGRRYMSLNEFQADLIRGLTDLAEGRDTSYARRMIQDQRVPLTPGEKLALKEIDTSLEKSNYSQMEKTATQLDEEARQIQGKGEYRLGLRADGAPSRQRAQSRNKFDIALRALNEGLADRKTPEQVEEFLLRLLGDDNTTANTILRDGLTEMWRRSNATAVSRLQAMSDAGIGSAMPGMLRKMIKEKDTLAEFQKEALFDELQQIENVFDMNRVLEDATRYSEDLTKAFLKGVEGDNSSIVIGLSGKKVQNARSQLSRDEVLAALPDGWYEKTVNDLVEKYKATDKQIGSGKFPYKNMRGYSRVNNIGTNNTRRTAEAVVNDVLDYMGNAPGTTLTGARTLGTNFKNWMDKKNYFNAAEKRLSEIDGLRPSDIDIQEAKQDFYTDVLQKSGIENVADVLQLRDKTIRSGGTSGYIQDVPFKTQSAFNQFALRAAVREAEKLGLDGVVVPDWADMSVMPGRLDSTEFTMGTNTDVTIPIYTDVATKIDEAVKKRTDFHTQEGSYYIPDENYLPVKDIKEIIDSIEDPKQKEAIVGLMPSNTSSDQFAKTTLKSYARGEELGEYYPDIAEDLVDVGVMKNTIQGLLDTGREQTKKYRAFKTNYGDVLDAGLQRLVSEGVTVENKPFGLYNPRENKIEPFGDIKRPARVIELTGKTKDIAKKVPSAYNKGGHVDIRGGIGAMARSVM